MSIIQSVVFNKSFGSIYKMSQWLIENGFDNIKYDIKANTVRWRQYDPILLKKKGYNKYYTKQLKGGLIDLIIAKI
jgi:hypothetical protein